MCHYVKIKMSVSEENKKETESETEPENENENENDLVEEYTESVESEDAIDSYLNLFNRELNEVIEKFEKKLHQCVESSGLSDENASRVIIVGITATSYYLTKYIVDIMIFIYYLMYWLTCVGMSVGASAIIVSYIHRIGRDDIVDFFYKDDEMLRLEFQNSNFEELYNLTLDVEKIEDFDYDSLKEEDNYFTVNISFHPVKKVIMYYDHSEKSFNYYTQTGDLMQPYLNAICRMYCLNFNTPELYTDVDDLKYMKETFGEVIDEDASGNSVQKTDSFVNVENSSDENEEPPRGWSALFARPKPSSKKQEKKEEIPTTIKYKKKGIISDYEFDQKQKNINTGNESIDYKTFLHEALNKKME